MWYFSENGQVQGPFTLEVMASNIQSGRVTALTIVWQENDSKKPARIVAELQPFFDSKEMEKSTFEKGTTNFIQKVQESTGVGQAEGFSLKGLFSETFKKHTDEEMENYFGVGTPNTTPALNQVNASWPTPWFFWRVLVLGLVGFFVLWTGYTKWENANFLPGAVLFGSFAVPIASLLFFFECNQLRNISLYQTLKVFLLGGIFGLLLAVIGFDFMPFAKTLGPSQAGLVEEPAKLAVLIILLSMGGFVNKNYVLNGLLLGASVGAGFAAFETAGYAFNTYGNAVFAALTEYAQHNQVITNPNDEIYHVIVVRGVLAPFAHVIWTAMTAAALWRVKGDREFEFAMLLNLKFLIVFVIAVVLHMLWNSNYFSFETYGYLRYLAIGFLGWLVIIGQIGIGLREIRTKQAEITPEPITVSPEELR